MKILTILMTGLFLLACSWGTSSKTPSDKSNGSDNNSTQDPPGSTINTFPDNPNLERDKTCMEDLQCGTRVGTSDPPVYDKTCVNSVVCPDNQDPYPTSGGGGIRQAACYSNIRGNCTIGAHTYPFTLYNNGYLRLQKGNFDLKFIHIYRNVIDLVSVPLSKQGLAVLTSGGWLTFYYNNQVRVVSTNANKVVAGRGGFAWINDDGSSYLWIQREPVFGQEQDNLVQVTDQGAIDVYRTTDHLWAVAYLFKTSSGYIAHKASYGYIHNFPQGCSGSTLIPPLNQNTYTPLNPENTLLLNTGIPSEATIQEQERGFGVSYTLPEGQSVTDSYDQCIEVIGG